MDESWQVRVSHIPYQPHIPCTRNAETTPLASADNAERPLAELFDIERDRNSQDYAIVLQNRVIVVFPTYPNADINNAGCRCSRADVG
jgi:hypothetical protein